MKSLHPALAGLAGIACATGVAAQTRPTINLITTNRVEIARGAPVIWPRIVDPSSWKQGLRLVHRSGPPGGQGEILAAVSPGDTTTVFLVENAELVPNRRRTIKLIAPNGQLIGFAVWTLVETGGKTTVSYDVFSETVVAPDQARSLGTAGLADRERTERAANVKRFDAELLALKKLVEGAP